MKQPKIRKLCIELVDDNPMGLGRYIAGTTHPCRNNATIQTPRGWMCKHHAKKCGFEYTSIFCRKNTIELTKPEINHLLGLLETNDRTQEYTAPCEQYWKRHLRIKDKLLSA